MLYWNRFSGLKSGSDKKYYDIPIGILKQSDNFKNIIKIGINKNRAETRLILLQLIAELCSLLVKLDSDDDRADGVPGGGG